MYAVYIIKTNGEVERTEQPKAPRLEQCQKAVGGYIETIPYFTKYENHKRGTAFCNENGIAENLPYNGLASKAWQDSVGPGKPINCELLGNVIYYAKI